MAAASMQEWFDIQALVVRYATSLDAGRVEDVVACFAPQALLESPVLGRFEGHEGVREFAARTARLKAEAGVQFRHVVTNLVADVDGDRARATCYLLDFRTRDGATALLSPGAYECDLVRVDGQWRIARRAVTMDQRFGVDDL